jgi:hypothetical protein
MIRNYVLRIILHQKWQATFQFSIDKLFDNKGVGGLKICLLGLFKFQQKNYQFKISEISWIVIGFGQDCESIMKFGLKSNIFN